MQSTRNSGLGSVEAKIPSIIAEKFGFDTNTVETDLVRWNKDWEAALRSLSTEPPTLFFNLISRYFRILFPSQPDPNHPPPDMTQHVTRQLRREQTGTAALYDEVGKTWYFKTPWLLLDDKERQRHILNGMRDACGTVSWNQDVRAMCPEITLGKLSKDKGKAFLAFVDEHRKGIEDANPEIYFVPNVWWRNVVETVLREASNEMVEKVTTLMSLLRNSYIASFVAHTGASVMKDLSDGSPAMDPIHKLMESEPQFASAIGSVLGSVRSKPIVRCENCTKSADMIEGTPRFMVCSVCKSKLDFIIHYCSPECQKDDWRNHKKHCGKAKVSKQLKGTIHDPFWFQPAVPDFARDFLPITTSGNIDPNDTGFIKPERARPFSPALQRQMSLCFGDRVADYFLFDETDHPIRVRVPLYMTRILFRQMRSLALSSGPDSGLGVCSIGDYLLKSMSGHPKLSREHILAQLGREYGEDIKGKLLNFERSSVERGGVQPGGSFLDKMGMMMTPMMDKLNTF